MSKELEAARALVKMLEEKEHSGEVELSTFKPGDIIDKGERKYKVMKQLDGMTVVASLGFMAKNKEFDSDSTNYGESDLKELIETEIQPLIEKDFGAENLVEHVVDLTTVDMQRPYVPIICKVRPATFNEAREFNDLLVAEDIGDWWWTCTPWSTKERGWEYSVAVVSPSGDFNNRVCSRDGVVRPFCILKSNIFVSKGEA